MLIKQKAILIGTIFGLCPLSISAWALPTQNNGAGITRSFECSSQPGTPSNKIQCSPKTESSSTGKAVGTCSGTRIEQNFIKTSSGKILAYVELYYSASTGRNCARTVSYGSLYGVSKYMDVYITRAGGGSVSDSGNYRYYAGPVSISAPGQCIYWGGTTSYNGVLYGIAKGPGHCG